MHAEGCVFVTVGVCAYYVNTCLCSWDPGSLAHNRPPGHLPVGPGVDDTASPGPLACTELPGGGSQSLKIWGCHPSWSHHGRLSMQTPGFSLEVSCPWLHTASPTAPNPPLDLQEESWFARLFMKHEQEDFFFFLREISGTGLFRWSVLFLKFKTQLVCFPVNGAS